MAFNNYRKRRKPNGPSKNELRAARHEKADLMRTHAGTLQQKFPNVAHLELNLRMEGASGVALGQEFRTIGLEEPLDLRIPCPSTCGNGQFNLLDALEESIASSKESDEGLRICQAVSYMNSQTACGTKLYYRFTIDYKGEQHA